MAAIGAARLSHPHHGRAAAVGPRLLIHQGKFPLISQLTSIYLQAVPLSAALWTRVVAVTALPITLTLTLTDPNHSKSPSFLCFGCSFVSLE